MENDIDFKLIINILNNINNKLDKIEERLIKIEGSQNKMDTHIDFIEDIYDNVKHPLNYITNKVNNYLQYTNDLALNNHES